MDFFSRIPIYSQPPKTNKQNKKQAHYLLRVTLHFQSSMSTSLVLALQAQTPMPRVCATLGMGAKVSCMADKHSTN